MNLPLPVHAPSKVLLWRLQPLPWVAVSSSFFLPLCFLEWIALLCFAVVLVLKKEAEQKEVTEVRWVVGGTVRWADAEVNIPSSTIIFTVSSRF